jgi:DNA-binding NarL/FixJ family response regulator
LHTVAICDTEPIVIEGLRRLLEPQEGLHILCSGDSPAQMLELIRANPPRVVLIDKAFGVPAVLDFVRALRRIQPLTSPVVWGTTLSDAEVLRFLQAGAAGVVRKDAPLRELLACIRTAAAGNTWAEETVAEPAHSPLTAREVQVAELVEHGMKNRDIAGTLGITTGTVKIHLKHIFEKTGIRGRYGLALSGLKAKGVLPASGADAA